MIATRNPDYWRKDMPYLDEVVWRIIPDNAAAAAAVESGQVQVSPYSKLSLADLNRLKGDKNLEVSGRGSEGRSEEHTSELQSLMRTSYAVFCLKKKKRKKDHTK